MRARNIASRIRSLDSPDAEEAADMLEFFFGQMQMHSPHMGGQHRYRLNSGG